MKKLDQQMLIFSKDYKYFDGSYKIGNFAISDQYVIFWNHFKSWRVQFGRNEFDKTVMKSFALRVDKTNHDSFIRRVVVGPSRKLGVDKQDTLFFCIR